MPHCNSAFSTTTGPRPGTRAGILSRQVLGFVYPLFLLLALSGCGGSTNTSGGSPSQNPPSSSVSVTITPTSASPRRRGVAAIFRQRYRLLQHGCNLERHGRHDFFNRVICGRKYGGELTPSRPPAPPTPPSTRRHRSRSRHPLRLRALPHPSPRTESPGPSVKLSRSASS